MKIDMVSLMQESSVSFGTSGARGLVKNMTDKVCYLYARAFLSYCEPLEKSSKCVAIAGDLRPSTERILSAVYLAANDAGWKVEYAGKIPSPAIALYGIEQKIPTVMVTGSHIPDDRNGIKFNHAFGEITKEDERGIISQVIEIDETLFDENGMLRASVALPEINREIESLYESRYAPFFGERALADMKIGVYQHSAVGRDLTVNVLCALGAQVFPLGRSETFIPVDTEAIRKEDCQLAKEWIKGLDAIVSTDGDSDRPLLSDENGEWLRGDVLGILAASSLGISRIATPVSCNTALEKCGRFEKICRTKIGSPYVIEGMISLDDSSSTVAGYEANGGFLLQTDLVCDGRVLKALPTRDALLPILAVLAQSRASHQKISEMLSEIPPRFSASDRLKNFPTSISIKKIAEIKEKNLADSLFGKFSGHLLSVDTTDGYRMTFDSGEIIHLRPSGNAPEFRCYVETDSIQRSESLLQECLLLMESFRS